MTYFLIHLKITLFKVRIIFIDFKFKIYKNLNFQLFYLFLKSLIIIK